MQTASAIMDVTGQIADVCSKVEKQYLGLLEEQALVYG